MVSLRIKRVYDPPSQSDGLRVLVDRLWPRGLKKEDAKIDLWMKNIAPSPDLRRWFAHDPSRWEEFAKRYEEEIVNTPEFRELRKICSNQDVTLLFASRNREMNNAVVLRVLLSMNRK